MPESTNSNFSNSFKFDFVFYIYFLIFECGRKSKIVFWLFCLEISCLQAYYPSFLENELDCEHFTSLYYQDYRSDGCSKTSKTKSAEEYLKSQNQ